MSAKLAQILDALDGTLKLAGPKNPYKMIVFLNSVYPASDAKCAKGFEAMKRGVGLEAKKILAAPKAKLAKVMRSRVVISKPKCEVCPLAEFYAYLQAKATDANIGTR